MKTILKYSDIIAGIVAIALVGSLFLFTKQIIAVFNSEGSKEMAEIAFVGLRVYSLGFLLAGINIVKAGFFGAVGQAMACSVVSISRGIVAIIFFAFLLSRFWGITGVWQAFPASELFTFVLSRVFSRNN